MLPRHLAAIAVLVASAPAAAGELEFIVSPYFHFPTTNGKVGVGPFERPLDDSPADLFKELNWAAMGSVEVNNGEWGVNLDAAYLSIDKTEEERTFGLDTFQGIYTATVLRRIHPMAWAYAGVRYSSFGITLTCGTECAAANGVAAFERSKTKGWFEPVVGFRAELPFTESVDLTVIADAGGFGAGSRISVNVWPQVGFEIGKGAKALVGYRIIYVDYVSGSGKSRFVYDTATFGPTLGLEFRF